MMCIPKYVLNMINNNNNTNLSRKRFVVVVDHALLHGGVAEGGRFREGFGAAARAQGRVSHQFTGRL
jgi:hypothetical protein